MAVKPRVLVVDDDKKFGESLQRVLNNNGIDCIFTTKPKEAMSLAELQDIQVLIIDCLLPQMNGVELAVKLQDITHDTLPIFLMSGIYKDRNFSIASIKKTGAKSFLVKPFSNDDLLKQLSEHIEMDDSEHNVLPPVKALTREQNLTQKTIIAAINEQSQVFGGELPLLVSNLSKYKATGKLTLKHPNLEMNIHFDNGIVQMPLQHIRLGTVRKQILENEWCLKQDIQSLGDTESLQSLVEQCLISPHFAKKLEDKAVEEHFLSITSDWLIDTQFLPADRTITSLYELNEAQLHEICAEYIHKKIKTSWLKTYFLPVAQYCIASTNKESQFLQKYFSKANFQDIKNALASNVSLTDIVEKFKGKESEVYRATYLALSFSEIYITKTRRAKSDKRQLDRLNRLLKTVQEQNYFELLGVNERCTPDTVKKSFNQLAKTLHPDKIETDSEEIKRLSEQIFDEVKNAYDTLKTEEGKNKYLKELKQEDQQKLVSAEGLIQNAIQELTKGSIKKAAALIEEADSFCKLPDATILRAWCTIKMKSTDITKANQLLFEVPSEKKDSALFFHTKGLIFAAQDEYEKAKTAYQNALAKDGNFLPTRRELTLIQDELMQQNESTNILTADLKDVVGLLFKKK